MSYIPNPATGGLASMTEYQNAVPLGIDQVNTYHPLWTSGITSDVLDGWTFTSGQSGTYTAVANAGGGQIQVTLGAHTLVAGQPFALTSSSVAGYQPPNPTIFIIQSVTATTVNVLATFTTTATGAWAMPSYLKAGTGAAGKYEITWSLTAKATTGANKQYHFEPCQNITNLDKAASGNLINSTGPQGGSRSSEVTIVDLDFRLKRYAQ